MGRDHLQAYIRSAALSTEGGSTRTYGIRKELVGELNSPVVEWLNRGLMDNPQLGHFFGVRKYLRGEMNSLQWLKQGLNGSVEPYN
eukprot:104787-Pyramimonas_sp.AAC.2